MDPLVITPGTNPDAVVQQNPLLGGAMLIVWLAVYVYMAYALYTLSKKTNTSEAWMSWIPILNVFQTIRIAGKPLWWFILMLIPFVNIIIGIVLWMKIAERVGKPSWYGILMILPLVNFVIVGILAFSKTSGPAAPAPVQMPPSTPAAPMV